MEKGDGTAAATAAEAAAVRMQIAPRFGTDCGARRKTREKDTENFGREFSMRRWLAGDKDASSTTAA